MKTKELKKTVFIAEDGTEFLDYDECIDHERKCDLEKTGLTTDEYDKFEKMFGIGWDMDDDDEYITEAYERFMIWLRENPLLQMWDERSLKNFVF